MCVYVRVQLNELSGFLSDISCIYIHMYLYIYIMYIYVYVHTYIYIKVKSLKY